MQAALRQGTGEKYFKPDRYADTSSPRQQPVFECISTMRHLFMERRASIEGELFEA